MQNRKNINVAILAGGKGTRLRSVVSDKPKVLADVNNRPFLAYLLDKVERSGFKEVIFCSRYMANAIESFFGPCYNSLNIKYSEEETPLDTGGALRHSLLKVTSDVILVMNGDSYIEADLVSFVDSFYQKGQDACMMLTEVSDVARFGSVLFDHEMAITSFEEKGNLTGPGWINAGVYLLKRSLIAEIPEGCPFSLEREFFPNLSRKGLFGYCAKGDFIDIGTPESYATAEKFFAKH